MNLTPEELAREAAATGFPSDTLEKVFRLMSLLDALYAHPSLEQRIHVAANPMRNSLVHGGANHAFKEGSSRGQVECARRHCPGARCRTPGPVGVRGRHPRQQPILLSHLLVR